MRFSLVMKRVGLSYCRVRHLSKVATEQLEKSSAQKWQAVIGLEIHAQIASESKLFSAAGTGFAAPVNNQVSHFDAALPGTLPVLNQECVRAGVKTALALNSSVNLVSRFDRKHYFYADLPAGYQITQQRQPLATGGRLSFPVWGRLKDAKESYIKSVRITQLQLEQDSGKSLHDAENSQSLIDLNRAGVPLMEIVTEPDFTTGEEAAAFVKELRLILETLRTCHVVMSEGNLRVDASISMHHPGEALGQRAEVKNINSIKFVKDAIEYEIMRQTEVLDSGGEVVNETRSYDPDIHETVSMRDKEKLHDYRFLPEPNLPPLHLYTNETAHDALDREQVINVDEIRDNMPELPSEQRVRLQRKYGLSLDKSIVIVNEPGLLEFFEAVMRSSTYNVQNLTNLLLNEGLGFLNKHDITMADFRITPEQFGEVVDMYDNHVIALSTVKEVLQALYDGEGTSAKEIVEHRGWQQVTDPETLRRICQEVIDDNPKALADYRKGKAKVFKYFLGAARSRMENRVSAKVVTATLWELLKDELNAGKTE